MVPIFVLTTILVVKVRKSLRDGKRHGIEKKRCDVSMIEDARQDSNEKGITRNWGFRVQSWNAHIYSQTGTGGWAGKVI
jgi:hypothetical protein